MTAHIAKKQYSQMQELLFSVVCKCSFVNMKQDLLDLQVVVTQPTLVGNAVVW